MIESSLHTHWGGVDINGGFLILYSQGWNFQCCWILKCLCGYSSILAKSVMFALTFTPYTTSHFIKSVYELGGCQCAHGFLFSLPQLTFLFLNISSPKLHEARFSHLPPVSSLTDSSYIFDDSVVWVTQGNVHTVFIKIHYC